MFRKPRGGMVEQAIAPRRRIERAAFLKKRPPFDLDGSEEVQALLPMRGQVGHDVDHAIVEQIRRVDILDQQSVHRRSGLARQPQQSRSAGRVVSHRFGDQSRQSEQAPLRVDR